MADGGRLSPAANSLKRWHPEWQFHILLNDAIPPALPAKLSSVDVIFPIHGLPVDNIEGWMFGHDVVELCTATKSFYLKHLAQSGFEYMFYFDPDMIIYNDLSYLKERLDVSDAILTPHCNRVATTDVEVLYTEMSVLAHGVFNLGFIGVRNTEKGHSLIDFWCRRMVRYCHDDHARGLFTDQKWFNLAPVFFPWVRFWTMTGATPRRGTSAIVRFPNGTANPRRKGQAAVFPFFRIRLRRSAADVRKFSAGTTIMAMISNYDKAVQANLEQFPESTYPWALAKFDNGEPITRGVRRYYRSTLRNRAMFGAPFSWMTIRRFIGTSL